MWRAAMRLAASAVGWMMISMRYFPETLAELRDDIGAEAVDEAGDVVDDVERVVVDERGEVHGEGERVAAIHAVAFEKGGVGAAAAEHGEVVAFAAGDLAESKMPLSAAARLSWPLTS